MARSARKTRATARPINMRDLGEAASFPGIDPRTWASYGIVDGDGPVVDFDDDLGPMVYVTLQPSQVDAYCRVAQQIAGDGEGEFSPWVGGDEVLVVMPMGRADDAPCIVGRLNNTRQKWPKDANPGGQDPTKNTFGFRRVRAPRIEEYAGSYLLRQSPSGALLSIDTAGIVTIRDGAGSALQLSPDVFGYHSSDSKYALQLDLSGGRAMVQASDARLILAGSEALPPGSSLQVPGLLSIMTASQAAAEHAISTEAVANLLAQWGIAIVTLFSTTYSGAVSLVPTPTPGAPLAALAAPMEAALAATFADATALIAAIQLAAISPQLPAVASAIAGAFQAAIPKPVGAVTAGFQPAPGIGCAGTFVG